MDQSQYPRWNPLLLNQLWPCGRSTTCFVHIAIYYIISFVCYQCFWKQKYDIAPGYGQVRCTCIAVNPLSCVIAGHVTVIYIIHDNIRIIIVSVHTKLDAGGTAQSVPQSRTVIYKPQYCILYKIGQYRMLISKVK